MLFATGVATDCSFKDLVGIPPTSVRTPELEILEQRANITWTTLEASLDLGISQGEETITDNNLLAIKAAGVRGIKLWKCPKSEERVKGIDWEWFIGSNTHGWIRYAVQAKKIDLLDESYKALRHTVKGINKNQIELLNNYASKAQAIPLYCFYNYLADQSNLEPYWHCGLPFDQNQLGCTVVPLSHVRKALRRTTIKTRREFRFIHSSKNSIPWRCLVGCPTIMKMYQEDPPPDHPFSNAFHLFNEIPIEIYNLFEYQSKTVLPDDYEIVPARIMVIELNESNFEERTQEIGPHGHNPYIIKRKR